MEQRLPRVAITQGDTNGVGYELIFKALEDASMLELFTPIVYGEAQVAAFHAQTLGLNVKYTVIHSADEIRDGVVNLLSIGDNEPAVGFGKPNEQSGEAGLRAIDRALDDYQEGAFDALVTAPLDNNTAFHFSGQSRYVEDHLDGDGRGFTLLVSERLRVALATRNLPLRQVNEALTREHVVQMAEALHHSIRRDFRTSNPRVAVLALNPKAGENGLLGSEEQELIAPAVQELSDKGVAVFGPYATDTFFGGNDWMQFDAVMAMYYDQALTPFRSLSEGEGCSYTAGLELVHTAPLTAALDGAGEGHADPTSLRQAIYFAIDILRSRLAYDAPLANPLKKLYKEKREDGDRSRFTVKGGKKNESKQ